MLFLFLLFFQNESNSAPNLWEAARTGQLDEVRRMLESGVPVNSQNSYGQTPLFMATMTGNLEVMSYLLEKGADPNLAEQFYLSTPLEQAFQSEVNENIIFKLLDHGAAQLDKMILVFIFNDQLEKLKSCSNIIRYRPLGRTTRDLGLLFAKKHEDPALISLFESMKPIPDPPALKDMPPFFDQQVIAFSTEGNEELSLKKTADNRLSLRVGDNASLLMTTHEPFVFVADTDHLTLLRVFLRGQSLWYVQLSRGLSIQYFSPKISEDPADKTKEPKLTHWAPPPIQTREICNDWPGFLGPEGRGHSDGQDLPENWDVEKGTNIRWQKQIAGLGNASPVVWGNKVFIVTAISSAGDTTLGSGNQGGVESYTDLSEHSWKVMALDLQSGKLLWEKTAATAIPMARRHIKSTQANATPVTDGQRLVTVFPTAGMFCYDLDGNQLWRVDLGGLDASWFFDPSSQWGFASSPLLFDGKVILQVDIKDTPYVAAWDLATGKQLWKTLRPGLPSSWATPSIFTRGEYPELVLNGSTILGYRPEDGSELWRLGPNSELVVPRPIMGQDRIIVTSGYSPVQPIYAIRPGSRGDLTLPDGKTSSSKILWSQPKGGPYIGTPVLYRGLLYIYSRGIFSVYDVETGSQYYRQRLGTNSSASLIASDDRIFLCCEEGDVYVLATGPQFKQLAMNPMNEVMLSTPAIGAKTLLLRTRTSVVAVGKKN